MFKALKVEFDPSQTSYRAIMSEFFKQASPFSETPDCQYKTAIWTNTEQQKAEISRMVDELEAQHGRKVEIDIQSAQPWTDAEEYHQQYLFKAKFGRM